MKKLVSILIVPVFIVVAQAALAANFAGPQSPQPVPPILYPGPNGPTTGPVDPTPVEPPPGN
jgi:hypothetical protein